MDSVITKNVSIADMNDEMQLMRKQNTNSVVHYQSIPITKLYLLKLDLAKIVL